MESDVFQYPLNNIFDTFLNQITDFGTNTFYYQSPFVFNPRAIGIEYCDFRENKI